MDNNERYRRIRYALQLSDSDATRLLISCRQSVSEEHVLAWRLKPDEPGFQACPAGLCSQLLQGFIVERRGPPKHGAETKKAAVSQLSTNSGGSSDESGLKGNAVPAESNNSLMKQLRIALNLRAEDVRELIVAGGGQISKSETNALFRRPDARNFRRCGDQVFKQFLKGIAQNRDS